MENTNYQIDTFVESSVIEGFNVILKSIVNTYRVDLRLEVSLRKVGIDAFDLVTDKNETQLLKVIQLFIGIIINKQLEDYIQYMMEMEDEEAHTMQNLCQDTIKMVEDFPELDDGEDHKNELYGDSPEATQDKDFDEQKYIDKIADLNNQIKSFDLEKRRFRIEISDEK